MDYPAMVTDGVGPRPRQTHLGARPDDVNSHIWRSGAALGSS